MRCRMLMQHMRLPFCRLLHHIAAAAAAAAQSNTITVYERCNFAGRARVFSVGNYASLASPVSLQRI
jgi:hypothetical protein